jgi:putative ATPase
LRSTTASVPGRAPRYRYPHDAPDVLVEQQYPPDELVGRDYYEPSNRGAERPLAERLPKLRAAVRGLGDGDTGKS